MTYVVPIEFCVNADSQEDAWLAVSKAFNEVLSGMRERGEVIPDALFDFSTGEPIYIGDGEDEPEEERPPDSPKPVGFTC